LTEDLRRRGIVMRPSDLGIDTTAATRDLLAAQTLGDLVACSGGLYAPPAKFLRPPAAKPATAAVQAKPALHSAEG